MIPPARLSNWPLMLHRTLARHALGAARFVTLTGSTRGQRAFWRVGAAISTFGGLIVIASELGTLAALLTLSAWRTAQGGVLLAVHALAGILVGYFVVGLIRGMREPLGLGLSDGGRP